MLAVRNLTVSAGGRTLVNDITFDLAEGNHLVIAGETGSGKTTLLKCIAGLSPWTSGTIDFLGRRIGDPSDKLIPGEKGIAYLSQYFELQKFLRVEQVLTYASVLPTARAEALYAICDIASLLTRRTDELSGGERQRVALARLLTTSPRLLLLDEPWSNLDRAHKETLKSVISAAARELGITTVLVSHDPADVLSWADDILVLRDGAVLQKGSPAAVYELPSDEYCAALFGSFTAMSPGLFARLTGGKNGQMPRIIRPSMIVLTTGDGGVTGTVTRVRYFGSYYEADIMVEGENVIALCDGETRPGTRVGVELKNEPDLFSSGSH